MDHETRYYQLVTEENNDALYRLISKPLQAIGYQTVAINVLTEGGFPYVDCRVRTEEVFCAQMIGFFVDLMSLFPDYTQPYYYLPAVVVCEGYDDRINGLVTTLPN